MSKIAVITDSVGTIPLELQKELDIRVVPLTLQFAEKTYLDGVDLQPQEFYHLLRQAEGLPTTSQVTPYRFKEVFASCYSEGAEAIVGFFLSRKLSQTVQSAFTAKKEFLVEHPDVRVEIVDTQTAAMSQGWMAIEAARVVKRGGGVDDALERAEEVRSNGEIFGVLHTLEYLQRGGRIGRAATFLGNLLHVLPVITINAAGEVDAVQRVRSKKKGLEWMRERLSQQASAGKKLHLAVIQADAEGEAKAFYEQLVAEFVPVEHYLVPFTPVMGVHTGPGVLGVSYFWEA